MAPFAQCEVQQTFSYACKLSLSEILCKAFHFNTGPAVPLYRPARLAIFGARKWLFTERTKNTIAALAHRAVICLHRNTVLLPLAQLSSTTAWNLARPPVALPCNFAAT